MESQKKTINRWIKAIVCTVCILCCGCSTEGRDYFEGKVPEVRVPIVRFDNELLSITEENVAEKVRELYATYPIFMRAYVEDMLGILTRDTAYLEEQLPQFLADTVYGFKWTNEREQRVFAQTDDIQRKLNDAFGRLVYLYPEWKVPTIYIIVSGFQTAVYFVNDTTIALGADMYLGSDYEYYNKLVYLYQKQTMRKECVVADIVSAYLFQNIAYTSAQARLLDQMIYRGKIMYLLSVVSPEAEHEIMGWSKDKWAWCKQNERGIWAHMMDQRDLFKTETLTISGYLNDGPFTAEIGQMCPARVGTWIGLQIVRSYMENNPEVTLQELMDEADAQHILEYSKYKP